MSECFVISSYYFVQQLFSKLSRRILTGACMSNMRITYIITFTVPYIYLPKNLSNAINCILSTQQEVFSFWPIDLIKFRLKINLSNTIYSYY